MIYRNAGVGLALGAGYIAGALALKAAEKAGFLGHAVAAQALQVFTGLALAVYANFIPKNLGTFRSPMAALRMQQVLRVSGWTFTMGGLAFAVASLLPVPDAVPLALLSAATAYVLGYSGRAFMECSASDGAPRHGRPAS